MNIHQEYTDLKERKLQSLGYSPSVRDEEPIQQLDKAVVCIPETLDIPDLQKKALSNGLNYIPTQKRDVFQATVDTNHFICKVKLRAHFYDRPSNNDEDGDENDPFKKYKQKRKAWTPPAGEYDAVDEFVADVRKQLSNLAKQPETKPESNISGEERQALITLKSRDDLYINKADKGGAIVIWDKELYNAEGKRQLSDRKFYKPLSRDITAENQQKVVECVEELIENEKLPPTARNLLVEDPATSYFYLLAKIHKANNPGRPIVSNINCPTYQIAKYLSEVLRPIVEQLPTYIRDTTHLLNIVEQFQFSQKRVRPKYSQWTLKACIQTSQIMRPYKPSNTSLRSLRLM